MSLRRIAGWGSFVLFFCLLAWYTRCLFPREFNTHMLAAGVLSGGVREDILICTWNSTFHRLDGACIYWITMRLAAWVVLYLRLLRLESGFSVYLFLRQRSYGKVFARAYGACVGMAACYYGAGTLIMAACHAVGQARSWQGVVRQDICWQSAVQRCISWQGVVRQDICWQSAVQQGISWQGGVWQGSSWWGTVGQGILQSGAAMEGFLRQSGLARILAEEGLEALSFCLAAYAVHCLFRKAEAGFLAVLAGRLAFNLVTGGGRPALPVQLAVNLGLMGVVCFMAFHNFAEKFIDG